MRRAVEYFTRILIHKWFVFIAGRKLGVPVWQLLIHDLSKFGPAEFGPYKRRFMVGRSGRWIEQDPEEFQRAWLHHIHRNPHHWEHWIIWESSGPRVLEMPYHYALEMVADWAGAGRTYTGRWDFQSWYAENKERMLLHPNTRNVVEAVMQSLPITAHAADVRWPS